MLLAFCGETQPLFEVAWVVIWAVWADAAVQLPRENVLGKVDKYSESSEGRNEEWERGGEEGFGGCGKSWQWLRPLEGARVCLSSDHLDHWPGHGQGDVVTQCRYPSVTPAVPFMTRRYT